MTGERPVGQGIGDMLGVLGTALITMTVIGLGYWVSRCE